MLSTTLTKPIAYDKKLNNEYEKINAEYEKLNAELDRLESEYCKVLENRWERLEKNQNKTNNKETELLQSLQSMMNTELFSAARENKRFASQFKSFCDVDIYEFKSGSSEFKLKRLNESLKKLLDEYEKDYECYKKQCASKLNEQIKNETNSFIHKILTENNEKILSYHMYNLLDNNNGLSP